MGCSTAIPFEKRSDGQIAHRYLFRRLVTYDSRVFTLDYLVRGDRTRCSMADYRHGAEKPRTTEEAIPRIGPSRQT